MAVRYYVTAKDGPRHFFLAGPYHTKTFAEAQVDPARRVAMDFKRNSNAGRAAFMAYRVCKWTGPSVKHAPKSALGDGEIA